MYTREITFKDLNGEERTQTFYFHLTEFETTEWALMDDLEELVAYADSIGFYTNLITSGIGLTEERLLALKAAGLKQIQLSLQAIRSELTDELVGARALADFGGAALRAVVQTVLEFLGRRVDGHRVGRGQLVADRPGQRGRVDGELPRRRARGGRHVLRRTRPRRQRGPRGHRPSALALTAS